MPIDPLEPIDEQTVTNVPIDPASTNPIEVDQTSQVQTLDGGGVDDDGFAVGVNVTGSEVAEKVNLAIVIDQSGSTDGDSGTDFDGDGINETILEAELYAAQELFDAYEAAGYNTSELTFSVITYNGGVQTRGTYTLDDGTAFTNTLIAIAGETGGGTTNYVAGLGGVGTAWTDVVDENGDPKLDANGDQVVVDPADTNVVVFMSDGFPFPSGQDIAGAAQDLEDDWNANITGIGLGVNSSLDALNELDNTGGATQVLTGQQLLDIVVAPLTDADFLRFEITIEGEDINGDPLTETLTFLEGDPHVNTTQLGWSINDLELDPALFPAPQEITVTFDAVFAEDPGNPGSGEQVVTTEHTLPLVICFTPGTRILTPNGQVAIEDLEIGDRVITRDHGIQCICWIGATKLSAGYVAAMPSLRPILIRKGALGENQPEQDMRLSRQHRVLVRDWRAEVMFGVEGGVLVPAFSLCNDKTVIEEKPTEDVVYIHMAFDDHEVIYADGIEAESFHPAERTVSHMNNAQKTELFTLFPELQQGDGFAFDSARRQVRGQEARVLGPLES